MNIFDPDETSRERFISQVKSRVVDSCCCRRRVNEVGACLKEQEE